MVALVFFLFLFFLSLHFHVHHQAVFVFFRHFLHGWRNVGLVSFKHISKTCLKVRADVNYAEIHINNPFINMVFAIFFVRKKPPRIGAAFFGKNQ